MNVASFQVSCRAEKILETIIDCTWEISPQLNLFHRWRQLFPEKKFNQLTESVRLVYLEVLEFWVHAIAHFRRGPLCECKTTRSGVMTNLPLVNRLIILAKPQVEANFKKRQAKIFRLTKRVRDEVDTAHMQSVKSQLDTIETLISPNFLSLVETSLPRVRHVTHSQNHRFFGRANVLKQMHDSLSPSIPPSQRRFILCGPGGSGKTQIALEYTYQTMADFKAVIWILADSGEKLEQGFRDAATLIGMPPSNSSQAKAYVLQRLAVSGKFFLHILAMMDDCPDIYEQTTSFSCALTTLTI